MDAGACMDVCTSVCSSQQDAGASRGDVASAENEDGSSSLTYSLPRRGAIVDCTDDDRRGYQQRQLVSAKVDYKYGDD